MQALRDTAMSVNGRRRSRLEEVDWISSVPGGSFSSACFNEVPTRFAPSDEQADRSAVLRAWTAPNVQRPVPQQGFR